VPIFDDEIDEWREQVNDAVAAVSDESGIFPVVQNRPRLHAVADLCLRLRDSSDAKHQTWLPAVLACCHKLAAMRPDEAKTAEVVEARAIGLGSPGWDVDGLPGYFWFMPRDDDDARMDQQTGFAECATNGVVFCLGGNGAGTTSSVLMKAVRFMLENAPVRKNCPFWFIAGSYEQTMSLYDEKLDQKGFLPPYTVQQDKIKWYNSNSNWPYRVPLKPDENGNNWVLEFKSYEQGRRQMQARSVGGFAFIEQFPWELLTEVLRGCRESSMLHYRGNKLAEFTPIDPGLSSNLEEMIRCGKAPADATKKIRGANYLPANWEVRYCNTEVAAELGHVDPQWFAEFSAMIPEDMRDVRLRGVFATYEGLIYKTLNPAVHFVGDEMWAQVPEDAVHHRSVDWGAGPENPFGCLWGLRDRREPVWWIYDEIYDNDQAKTTIEHLCDVQRQHKWRTGHLLYGRTFGDPSGVENMRIAQKLNQYVDASEGIEPIAFTAAYNRVLEGIEHVQYLLKASRKTIDVETGKIVLKPRLFIHEANCPNLCRELRSYRWEKSTGKGANPRDSKPVPLKKDDHLADALRYLTISHDRQTGADIQSAAYHSYARELVRGEAANPSWRTRLRK
jgi:hypothetical protein